MARNKIPRTRRDIYNQRERSRRRVVCSESPLDHIRRSLSEPASPTFTAPGEVVAGKQGLATVIGPAPPSAPVGDGRRYPSSTRRGLSAGPGDTHSAIEDSHPIQELRNDSSNGFVVASPGDVDRQSLSSTGAEDEVDMASMRVPPQVRPMHAAARGRGGVAGGGECGPTELRQDSVDYAPSSRASNDRDRQAAYIVPSARRKVSPAKFAGIKFPSRLESHDIDLEPQGMRFTCFDIFVNLVSMGSYLADVGADAFLAYMYYRDGHPWWFRLTLFFVFVPSFTMSIFSLKWYVMDHKASKKTDPNTAHVSRLRWISRAVCLMLQIAPVLRYFDTLIYGVRSQKVAADRKQHWYDKMLYEDTDSALLRLFECFMEAAPQLCLQLYIMCSNQGTQPVYLMVGQVLSAVTSLCSMAWAMCAYHRALRISLPSKSNMTWSGVILQFLWHFFTIAARIVAIAMFASYFKSWIFVLAGAHWCAMLIWILVQNTSFCDTKCAEFFFNFVAALVYIFCYFNLTEGHTRLRYVFYYIMVYSENAAMILVWYLFTQTLDIWYQPYAMATVLGGFFIGIFFQLLYYLKFHPNNLPPCDKARRIRWWIPLEELFSSPSEPSEFEMSDFTDGQDVRHSRSDMTSSEGNNVYLEDSDNNDCIQPLMGNIC